MTNQGKDFPLTQKIVARMMQGIIQCTVDLSPRFELDKSDIYISRTEMMVCFRRLIEEAFIIHQHRGSRDGKSSLTIGKIIALLILHLSRSRFIILHGDSTHYRQISYFQESVIIYYAISILVQQSENARSLLSDTNRFKFFSRELFYIMRYRNICIHSLSLMFDVIAI